MPAQEYFSTGMVSITQKWNALARGTRRWIVVSIVTAFGFFGLRSATGYLIDKELKDAVPRYTQGVYSLDYGSLRLNMLAGTVELDDMKLKLDDRRLAELYGERKMFFAINVERALIDVKMAWTIMFDQKLDLNRILVQRPQIELLRTPVVGDGLSKSSGDLYFLIADVLKELRIDQLKIENGSLDYIKDDAEGRSVTSFPDISFLMNGVLLDSASSFDKNRIYYTDDLELVLRDQRFELGDSIHEIAFTQLSLNTRNKEIRIDSASIGPMVHVNVKKSAESNNIYRNDLPLVVFSGTDFTRAYSENILHIEKILVSDPHYSGINKNRGHQEHAKAEQRNNVPALLSSIFKELYVDTFKVQNGSFHLELLEGQNTEVDHIDARFLALKIDSLTKLNDRFGFGYGDIYIKIKGHRITDAKKGKFDLGELLIDSEHNELSLEDITILSADRNRSTDLYLEKLELSGADLQLLIEQRILRADSLVLERPQIFIPPIIPSGQQNQELRKRLDVHTVIEPYLDLIEIGDVIVRNGTFEVMKGGLEHYRVGDLNVHLSDTRIDEHSITRERILYSDRSSLSLKDVEVGLHGYAHMLEAKEIGVLGLEERVIVRDLLLKYDPETTGSSIEQYEVEIPLFEIRGASIKKLVYEKEFLLSSLVLHDPKVKVNVFDEPSIEAIDPRRASGEKLSDLIRKLEIERVDVKGVDLEFRKNGTLQFSNKSAYINARDFSLDPRSITEDKLMLKVNDMNYGFQELLVFFNKKYEILRIGNTEVDLLERSATIENVHLSPSKGNIAESVEVSIPKITATGYDPFIGRYTRDVDLGHFIIHDPQITVRSLLPEVEDSSQFELPAIPERLPVGGLFDLFDTLQAATFEVQNASFVFEQAGEKDTVHIDMASASIALNDPFISTTSTFAPGRDLWAESIVVDLENVNFGSNDHSASLKKLRSDSKEKTLEVQSLHYSTGSSFDTTEMTLHVPTIGLSGFGLHDLIVDHDLSIERVLLDQPRLQMRNSKAVEHKLEYVNDEIGKAVKGEIEEFYIGLNEIGLREPGEEPVEKEDRRPLLAQTIDISSSGLQSVDLKEVEMQNGEVVIQREMEYEGEATHLQGLLVNVKGIHADDELRASAERPLYVSGIRVGLRSSQHTLGRGLEEIRTNALNWDVTNGTLQVQDLSLHPTVDNDTYGRAMGKQIEIFDVDSADISITGIDAFELAHGTGIVMDSMKISNARINIFKDKRLPFPFQIKNMPSRNILGSDRLIDIRYIELSDAFLHYSEFSETATDLGFVFLNDLSASLSNMTNDTALISRQPLMKIRSSSSMMGEGQLKLDIDFDLHLAYRSIFSAELVLGPMELTSLNSFVAPHDNIQIRSGIVDTLVMNIVADNDVAIGEMGFFYKKLKVDFLKVDGESEKNKHSLFKGLLANAVIKTGNKYNGKSKTHTVYAERNKSRSVINYILKALMSGMISTISPTGYKAKVKRVDDPILKLKLKEEGM